MKKLECDFYFLSKVDTSDIRIQQLPSLKKQAIPRVTIWREIGFGYKKFKDLSELCSVCNKFTFFRALFINLLVTTDSWKSFSLTDT